MSFLGSLKYGFTYTGKSIVGEEYRDKCGYFRPYRQRHGRTEEIRRVSSGTVSSTGDEYYEDEVGKDEGLCDHSGATGLGDHEDMDLRKACWTGCYFGDLVTKSVLLTELCLSSDKILIQTVYGNANNKLVL